jgi:mannose-6-phosphate isomerase-like protein (cupin superfamily)
VSEIELVCSELGRALDVLRSSGLRLDVIYPADDPHTAILSHGGDRIRLTSRSDAPPIPDKLPDFAPEFVLTRASDGSGEGRAGMLYRDLVPGRLGGRYIASQITIPDGGPVSDWVHFHRVVFQMIYVRGGWVRVVYQDQGEPFVMNAGDLVLQPPGIRHRVLECSPGLEVIEISCPALHETFAEHEMDLPNGTVDHTRTWSGQHFLRHIAAEAAWTPFGEGEAEQTAMGEATGGLAEVRTIRSSGDALAFPAHDGELVFGFVLEGFGTLEYREGFDVAAGDCFVIPPTEAWTLRGLSADFRLLHVTSGEVGQISAGDA